MSAVLLATSLLAGLLASAAPAPARPPADPDAMRDALGPRGVREPYASSRAYLHYLEARLAEQAGDTAKAIEELRLAVVYDDASPDLHTALGWLYARVNALDRAETEVRRALRLDARNAEAQLLLGRLLVAQHHNEEAVRALEKAIELAPQAGDPYVTLVRHLTSLGDLTRAEAVAERFSRVHTGEGEPWRLLAAAATRKGDAAAAERYLRTAATHEPWDFDSLLELAHRAADRGEVDAAQRDYDRILHRDPENADALLGAAGLALRRADDAAARAYFQQLLGSTADGDARTRAALTYLTNKRTTEALALLDEAARLEPGNSRIAYYRGLVLEEERRFADAAAAYLSLPARPPELHASSRARAASCLSLLGRAAEAKAAMLEAMGEVTSGLAGSTADEVIAAVPDVFRRIAQVEEGRELLEGAAARGDGVELRVAIARSLVDAGKVGEAVTSLREALKQSPEDERLVFALATTLDRTAAWQEGVELARGMLKRDERSASAMNFIGYAYADRGVKLDEARALIVEALRIRPGEGYYLDSLGWCELRRGNVRAAIEDLEKADGSSPGEPVILQHLGAAYARSGRRAEAIDAWKRALQLLDADPDPSVRPQIESQLRSLQSSAAR